ncbi:hypothetical protein [Streptococcus parauberis]|uniref:hypothetical protein n=1 Tax=Streptococcus parauberis TaxID=1348 RepID=UPI000E3091A6|nr:hypothetical protein [Streptococcus parauberis]RFE01448.1 hypothetical protein ADO06_01361 [Streptococcus parauberis]
MQTYNINEWYEADNKTILIFDLDGTIVYNGEKTSPKIYFFNIFYIKSPLMMYMMRNRLFY